MSMAFPVLARVVLLAVVTVSAVKAFIFEGVGSRCVPVTPSLARQHRASISKTATRRPDVAASAPFRMSSYEGSELSSGGEIGASSEMELQELIVDFTDDGRILLEVKGVKGPECRAITEDLIKALGDVITTENTEEYFEEKIVNVVKDPIKLGWSYDSSKPEW